MKKFFYLLAVTLFSSMTAVAQDIITTRDGKEIEAKVLEVGSSEIKYKLFAEPDGVTFVSDKTDIFRIVYESGRTEVFNDTAQRQSPYTNRVQPEGIVPGMKYKQLKHLYYHKDYISASDDRYSPAWTGVASFFITGLGECINGEWERGLGKVGANVGLYLLAKASAYTFVYRGEEPLFALATYAALGGMVAIDIWSIVDAVKIAKVKNMYEHDLRSKYSLDMNLYPSVNYAFTEQGTLPATGLTLAIRF